MLAGKLANGGNAWSRLSVVLGLRRLGFQSFFVEQIEQASPETVAYFEAAVRQLGLTGSAALVAGQHCYGIKRPELDAIAEDAALLINFGGHLTALQGVSRR